MHTGHTGCSLDIVFFPSSLQPISPAYRRATHLCKKSECTVTHIG